MVSVVIFMPKPRRSKQIGVAFLSILIAIAIGGIALAGTATLWQVESRREKEKELLFIGEEYRRAISSYYENSPGESEYPARLADLLQDPRFPMPVRHLRRLYVDPMSTDGKWREIRRQERIIGVASSSSAEPIKIGGFAQLQADFEGAKSYSEWRFIHSESNQGTASPVKTTGSKVPGQR